MGKMNCKSGVLLCCCVLTITTSQVAFADAEDKSDEVVGGDQEVKPSNVYNGSSSVEAGPPESHEAMNNREMINPKMREKRSYEFLMGIVNNNSKYEITKVDPTSKGHEPASMQEDSAAASELLLELMVKIAAHPDHWDKVHKLLQKIDADIVASKQIARELDAAKIKIEPKPVAKKEESTSKDRFAANQWPDFGEAPADKVSLVNTIPPDNYHRWQNSPHKPYQKTFAYHRVTGRPLYLNKNPKAYIAVSVIAPKPINTRSKDEDLNLEKELRQLKPWTHNQNLQNMASIRSRWVIQSDDNKKESVS